MFHHSSTANKDGGVSLMVLPKDMPSSGILLKAKGFCSIRNSLTWPSQQRGKERCSVLRRAAWSVRSALDVSFLATDVPHRGPVQSQFLFFPSLDGRASIRAFLHVDSVPSVTNRDVPCEHFCTWIAFPRPQAEMYLVSIFAHRLHSLGHRPRCAFRSQRISLKPTPVATQHERTNPVDDPGPFVTIASVLSSSFFRVFESRNVPGAVRIHNAAREVNEETRMFSTYTLVMFLAEMARGTRRFRCKIFRCSLRCRSPSSSHGCSQIWLSKGLDPTYLCPCLGRLVVGYSGRCAHLEYESSSLAAIFSKAMFRGAALAKEEALVAFLSAWYRRSRLFDAFVSTGERCSTIAVVPRRIDAILSMFSPVLHRRNQGSFLQNHPPEGVGGSPT